MSKTALMLDKLIPSAKILDGILVITLPDALRPVVWQMELGQTKSSAMEVRDGSDGTFMLVLKTPRQDVVEIAPYAAKDRAVRALIVISKALENGQGQLRSYAANSNHYLPAVIPQTEPARMKMARIAIGLLLVIGLLFFFTRLDNPAPDTTKMASGGVAGPAATGEPVSADDYLNTTR